MTPRSARADDERADTELGGLALHGHGLVGRKRELERVESFLGSLGRGPAALTIEGPAGIGKTVLWDAGRGSAAAQGHQVRSSRATASEAQLSLSTLLDLLDPLPDTVVDPLAPPRRDALLAALLREPARKPIDPRTLGVAVLDVLRAMSAERPLLLAIDDEQWIDPSSARLLAFALRRLRGESVGVLTTRRSDTVSDESGARLDAGLETQRLELGPMDADGIDVLIEERLGRALPLPTLHRVYEMSGGNPLFALEIVRGLDGDDLRIPAGGGLPVATNLQERLERRLARLPATARDALLVAATAAEPDLALVARVTGDDRAIEPAFAAGIVEPIGDRLRFAHPLLAAVAADGGTDDRRRAVHRALADATADPEVRARHLAIAAEGPDAAVAAALDEAARSARARGALPAAADLSVLAIRLTPPERAKEVARRRIDAATYHFLAGDVLAGIALIDEVLGSAPTGRLRAEAIALETRRIFEDVPRTVALLDDALREEALPPELEAELHIQYAWTLWRAADGKAALDHARTAVERAEVIGDAQLTCEAVTTLAAVTWGLGRRGVDRLLERALELDAQVHDDWLYVSDRPQLVAADVLGHDARFEESVAMFTTMLRDAREAGDEPSVASVLWNLGTVEISSGQWHLAREHLEEGVRLRRQEGVRPMEALASLAMLRACEGGIAQARLDVAEAIATTVDWRDLEGQLFCLRDAGLIELTAGEPAAACQPLVLAARTIRSSVLRSPDLCPIVADEIDALLAAGRTDGVESEVVWLEEWTRALGGWTIAIARRSRGHLSAVLGDLDGARRSLREAIAELERVGIPFECARTLMILGAVERRTKQKRAARDAFERAAAIFDELGAPVWVARARDELARVGGRPPAPCELTGTERQVAELVAAGRTNRDVAEALFMSPRTVETHLTRIYAKLGVHSRTELAATLVLERP